MKMTKKPIQEAHKERLPMKLLPRVLLVLSGLPNYLTGLYSQQKLVNLIYLLLIHPVSGPNSICSLKNRSNGYMLL